MEHTAQYYTLHLAKSYKYFTRCIRQNSFVGSGLDYYVAKARTALDRGMTPAEAWLSIVKPSCHPDGKCDSVEGLYAALAVDQARAGTR